VDLDLGFQLDDAGDEFKKAQSQGVELQTRQMERLGITRRIDHSNQ
jgi:hypothetical protein